MTALNAWSSGITDLLKPRIMNSSVLPHFGDHSVGTKQVLVRSYPPELSVIMTVFWSYAVQHGSSQTHVAIEHLKRGWGTEELNFKV